MLLLLRPPVKCTALQHAVRQNQLQRSSRLAQSSTRAGWIPEDADVHTIEVREADTESNLRLTSVPSNPSLPPIVSPPLVQDMEMTDYYQIIGKRIRVATHSSSPPAAAAASTTPIKNKSTWDLASNIEGRGECTHTSHARMYNIHYKGEGLFCEHCKSDF